MDTHTGKKWYQQTWVIILSFIVFFPIGFYLLWRQPTWSKRTKRVSTVFVSIVLVAIITLGVIFAPPSIDVTSALSPVKDSAYTLTGEVYPKSSEVTVNGKEADVHDGRFVVELDLKEGDNQIIIAVIDDGKKTEKFITIHRYTKAEIAEKFPEITTETISETEPIPFDRKKVESASLPKGTSKITTVGVDGIKTLTYTITYKNGKQSNKELTDSETTRVPVDQVTTVGTYVSKPKCDPNYSGACVPIASDVDCAGGRGNGPAYVNGPVYVVGSDIYGLDGDGNGVGCQ